MRARDQSTSGRLQTSGWTGSDAGVDKADRILFREAWGFDTVWCRYRYPVLLSVILNTPGR